MPDYLELDEIKALLKIQFDDDNALLIRLLNAAEGYLSDPQNGILRRPVLSTEFVETFDDFASVRLQFPDEITAYSVAYTDADGADQVLPDTYTIADGQIVLNHGEAWPARQGNVVVTYTSGWPEAPEPIKDAGYTYVQIMYDFGPDYDMQRMRDLIAFKISGFRRVEL